jgi:replicative DNA helicase
MPVFTVDHSGNVINIVATVEKVHKLHPNKKMIVSIDHSLLVEKYDEDNDNGVIAKLAAAAISIKKQYGAAVILLSQLRSSLQTPERRDPQFHYPVTDDIFGSKTLPQAADVVIMLNRPELIGITEYGPNKYSTKNLIALHITKNRDGYTALIRMKHDFEKGIIRQWEKDDEPTYSEDYQQELNI